MVMPDGARRRPPYLPARPWLAHGGASVDGLRFRGVILRAGVIPGRRLAPANPRRRSCWPACPWRCALSRPAPGLARRRPLPPRRPGGVMSAPGTDPIVETVSRPTSHPHRATGRRTSSTYCWRRATTPQHGSSSLTRPCPCGTGRHPIQRVSHKLFLTFGDGLPTES